MQRNGSWRLVRLVLVTMVGVFSVTGVLAQSAGYTLDWFVLGDERGLVMAYHRQAMERAQ